MSTPRAAQTVHLALWLLLVAALAATGCQSRRPHPRPTQLVVKEPKLIRLPSGLTLIHRYSNASEVVAIHATIEFGASTDPEDKLGLTNLTFRLLSKGTRQRSSDAVAERLEGMGASFSASAGQDLSSATLVCVAPDFAEAMDLFGEILTEPSFPWEEIDTERGRVLAQIRQEEDRPPALAMKRLRAELFRRMPYARPVEGTPESLAAITQNDIAQTYFAGLTAGRITLAVVGPIEESVVMRSVERHFAGLPPTTAADVRAIQELPPRTTRPDPILRRVQQSFIVIGCVTCPIEHADVPALITATTVLGGGMSSRLFSELRDRQGLAYAVGANTAFYRDAGFFYTYIGTKPETMDHAEEGLWTQVTALRTDVIDGEELERAKSYLIGNFLRDLETHRDQATRMASDVARGLGLDYSTRFPELVRAVTSRDIQRVANRYFTDRSVVRVAPMP